MLRTLSYWRTDTYLAGTRDAEALARFPEAEQKQWQELWADLGDLMADATFPQDPFVQPSPIWASQATADAYEGSIYRHAHAIGAQHQGLGLCESSVGAALQHEDLAKHVVIGPARPVFFRGTLETGSVFGWYPNSSGSRAASSLGLDNLLLGFLHYPSLVDGEKHGESVMRAALEHFDEVQFDVQVDPRGFTFEGGVVPPIDDTDGYLLRAGLIPPAAH